jgi:aminopeptidase N
VTGEPDGAPHWFPANDHPEDKATVTLRVTVPPPFNVAANGVAGPVIEQDGARTYHFAARDPMAPYLVTVAIGRFRAAADRTGWAPIVNYLMKVCRPQPRRSSGGCRR